MTHTPDLPVQPISLAIAATFTAEPLEQALTFWMTKLRIPVRIEFAPYNQLFQQLLNPASLLTTNQQGINIILVRLEDWLGITGETHGTRQPSGDRYHLEQNVRNLLEALRNAARQSPTTYVLCFCPASPSLSADPERQLLFKQMETLCVTALADVYGIHVLTNEQLAATYPVATYYDAHADTLAHIPFTPIFFTALATMIARTIYVRKHPPYKVIVLDCDHTLWNGVCGEDGPLGVQVDLPHKALQECMVRQHAAGMLLCLCSKNNEEDVAAVFSQQPDMPLRPEHIVSQRINWKPKSENLTALAAELQLGLDSFIFIDDDPLECQEVRTHCPQVLTLQLPQAAETLPRFLDHVWVFDHQRVTEEDRNRTALYQQHAQREQVRKDSLTFADFLAGLGLQIEFAPLSSPQLARVSELTQRTNQFNLTTIRRSAAELHRLCASQGLEGVVVTMKDRFGDYGLVGAILFMAGSETLYIDTFLLSCRALGRGVEQRMLSKMGEIAHERGLHWLEVPFVPTLKNRPAQDFLEHIGAEYKVSSGSHICFRFPAEFTSNLRYSPAVSQGYTVPTSEQSVRTATTEDSTSSSPAEATLLNAIATELYAAEEIHKAVFAQTRLRPATQTTFVAPQTPIEQQVAAIWSELLGVEHIGRNDSFFELGGHSLLAMQVLARIRETFQTEISPTVLFTSDFTVAALARTVSAEQIHQANPQDITMLLKKLNTLSDEEVQVLLANPDQSLEIEH